MSSSNTQENRNESYSNQPFVIGYPVEPSSHNVTIGFPAVETSAGGTNNTNNNNNNNNNAGRHQHNPNINRRATGGRPGNNNVNVGGGEPCSHFIGWTICISLLFWMYNVYLNYYLYFEIDSMVVSPLNISNSQGGAVELTVGMLAWNTNKHVSVDYRKFEVFIFHQRGHYFSNMTIPLFHQRHNNQTKLFAKTQANLENFGGGSVEAILAKNKDGIVNFDVWLATEVRYHHWFIQPSVSQDMVCLGVKVKFSPNATEATMLGGPTRCVIHDTA